MNSSDYSEEPELLQDPESRRMDAQAVMPVTDHAEDIDQELADFIGSICHSLRSPLWAVAGFTKALQDQYAGKMDEESSVYLDRIIATEKRISAILESLVHLTKICRHQLCLAPVDLSSLANSIAAQLQRDDAQRRAEFLIAPGLTAMGDTYLLQEALHNLFRNAWKFSKSRAVTRIEFGVMRNSEPGARSPESRQQQACVNNSTPLFAFRAPHSDEIYFIQDNGMGFDESLGNKLFRPFQRLHPAKQFEGLGMGLAVVRRVIRRHGGTVWGAGREGEGSIFCFTLGTADERRR